MSFDFSTVKWSWVVIGAIVAAVVSIVLSLVVQFGYGLVVGFQLRGAPPQEMLIEAFTSTPFLIVGVIITAIGAVVGGRMAARRSEDNPQLAGLVAGILMAVLALAVSVWQGGLDFWTLPNVVLAVIGGWVGGWLVGRRSQTSL
jgi:putative membrane protein (TIGR04086 family)